MAALAAQTSRLPGAGFVPSRVPPDETQTQPPRSPEWFSRIGSVEGHPWKPTTPPVVDRHDKGPARSPTLDCLGARPSSPRKKRPHVWTLEFASENFSQQSSPGRDDRKAGRDRRERDRPSRRRELLGYDRLGRPFYGVDRHFDR